MNKQVQENANEKQRESLWNEGLRKWLTPILLLFFGFVAKEYYTTMNRKLDTMVNYMYRHDSSDMRLKIEVAIIQQENRDQAQDIEILKQEIFFIKPDEIKVKRRNQ